METRSQKRQHRKRRKNTKFLGLTTKERLSPQIPVQEKAQRMVWVWVPVVYTWVGIYPCDTWFPHILAYNPHIPTPWAPEQQWPPAPPFMPKSTRCRPHTPPTSIRGWVAMHRVRWPTCQVYVACVPQMGHTPHPSHVRYPSMTSRPAQPNRPNCAVCKA